MSGRKSRAYRNLSKHYRNHSFLSGGIKRHMRDASLRRKKDDILNPLADRFLGLVHPNVISVIAMVVGLASVAVIMGRFFWLDCALGRQPHSGWTGRCRRTRRRQTERFWRLPRSDPRLRGLPGDPGSICLCQSDSTQSVGAGAALCHLRDQYAVVDAALDHPESALCRPAGA